jgi:hypothetical protein
MGDVILAVSAMIIGAILIAFGTILVMDRRHRARRLAGGRNQHRPHPATRVVTR